MKVYEYVGKRILKSYGLKILDGLLIRELNEIENEEIRRKVEELGFPQVLKSQVLVGGRMKAGGVVFSNSWEESLEKLKVLLRRKIKGETPAGILIEKAVPHDLEWYISLSIDRDMRDMILIFSKCGGVDVEEISSSNPDKVMKGAFDEMVEKLPTVIREPAITLKKIMVERDLTLIEINPVGITKQGPIMFDVVLHLDDNALYRQRWIGKSDGSTDPFHFVKLDGDIGVIGCGAGLVMATIDGLIELGCKPANFLDVGGGATMDVTLKALRKVDELGVRAIVMNIFGGITKCDEIARAIVKFTMESETKLFMRMTGTNEDEGREILKESKIDIYNTMDELLEAVVKWLKEGEK